MYRILICFIFLSPCLSAWAENWHPFPFQIAYYGKRVTLQQPGHPANPGYLIDALYLNQIGQMGNAVVRNRNLVLFPKGNPNNNPAYSISIGDLKVNDEPTQTLIEAAAEGAFFPLNGTYTPAEMKPGGHPFGMNSMVTSLSAQSHFGFEDSLAQVTGPGYSLTISKKLGIFQYQSTTDTLTWLGTKDLNIGYQDASGRMKKPSVGDQFHYRISRAGAYSCDGPFGSSSNGAYDIRESRMTVTQVLEDQVVVDEIESAPGSSTGILYQRTYTFFQSDYGAPPFFIQDTIAPIGCDLSDVTMPGWYNVNIGWLGDNGFSCTIATLELFDMAPTFIFSNCLKRPFSTKSSFFPMNSAFNFCTGTPIVAEYFPVFQQSSGTCTMGNPLPPVVVTSKQKTIQSQTIRLLPQPAQSTLTIEGIDTGEIRLINSSGKCLIQKTFDRSPVSIKHLPSGIYFYQIRTQNGEWSQGKVVKE